jgi:NitT/TauT family transport system permease protein
VSTSWLPVSARPEALPEKASSCNKRTFSGRSTSLEIASLGVGGLIVLVMIWWVATSPLVSSSPFLANFAPGRAFTSLRELLAGSDLWTHVWVSLRRVVVGLTFALLIGVPVGLAVGTYRRLNAATSPAFQFLRMISPLSWMPIAVMVLGIGDRPIYFLLTFTAVWPILLNTAEGVRRLEPSWLRLADSLAATKWETLRHVIFPGVLGHALAGLRLAIGVVWIVLVPCEMLGVSAGVGYFILDTRDRLAYSELAAMVVVIGALGYLLDLVARSLYHAAAPGLDR